MTNLKPCPFCGGQPTLEHHSEIKKPEECAEDCDECGCCDATHEFWAIAHRCKINNFDVAIDCGCFSTEAEAIEAWNTRYHSAFEETVIKAWEEIKAYQERTCHIVGEEYDDLLEYTSVEFSCGHYAIGLPSYFSYCPKCGAKVVEP